MDTRFILQGKVLWSYADEYAQISEGIKFTAAIVSLGNPLHNHTGYIALTENQIIIEGQEGDLDLTIPINAINEIYLGFDDVFTLTSLKNFGAFWQPLRLEFYAGHLLQRVYLIIDHNGLIAHNKRWYEALINILQG
ncbi:hypothetical protein [Mucilaginibacter polytrichastri]|uniref:Uncharacterized protein n=1 Tax=Mucilaginibacter polytrichastri TaxID=1302689 RepID=A0A1Q5ZTH1_9SPHI|nr:hypothetical protein [Mucilaginibacter polytrichastri]OKS84978.1 hypothetical protein RG47T_0416 [Mucilaginibacter polytrichastri]SFS46715.1 hypothetical protein SAMN04487890_101660 [Mucilaginibacter polytrichastri]